MTGDFIALLPSIAQLAQFEKYGAWIGVVTDIGIRFSQPGDHGRALQAKEGVEIPFLRQRRDECGIWVLIFVFRDRICGHRVIWFPVERELEVVDQVVMAGIEKCVVPQPV